MMVFAASLSETFKDFLNDSIICAMFVYVLL